MQTVRDIVLNNETSADIFEIRNAKPTGIFYYETDRVLNDFGGRIVEDVMLIKGIGGHDAVLRIFIKTGEKANND